MKYLELKIKIKREKLDAVMTALEAAGESEMIINDPLDLLEIEEHPEWYKYDYINEELSALTDEDPEIVLYFTDDEEGRDRADDAAKTAEASGASCSLTLTGDDSEWLYKWQEHFKPTKVGERTVVKPSWEPYDPMEGELIIEMDPGMAFGSGLHETTSLCIKALEELAKDKSFGEEKDGRKDIKLLDVGCGTGILSIAATRLFADECLGIDLDADAVRVAKENIDRNGLTNTIEIREGNLMDGVDYEPDVIVANLMADLVAVMAPSAAGSLRSGGIFISSGILDIKEDEVSHAVSDAGFEIKDILRDGEWRAIVAVKK